MEVLIDIIHRQPIACICISLSSTILLVGTTDGLIHMYDIPSHQLLRSISTHKGTSISHIQTIIKPGDLIGHISLEMKAGVDARDILPVKPVAPFQRIRDSKAREAHEVTLMWSPSKANTYSFDLLSLTDRVQSYQDALDYPLEELIRDHTTFVEPLGNEGSDAMSLKSRVSELESEMEVLREQLCKAKGVNDSMWDTVVQRLIKPSNSEPKDKGGEEEPKKKRGRT